MNILLALVLSFCLTIIIIKSLIKVAKSKNIQVPLNNRSVHINNVSALGGIAIFIGSALPFILFSEDVNVSEYKYLIICSILLFGLGLYDDFKEIKPIHKFIGQFIVVFIIVVYAQIKIHVFSSYCQDKEIANILNTISSIFIIITIINAYNFIDGIDLLASVIAFIFFASVGFWFYLLKQTDYSLLLLTLSASLLAFIIYNFPPAKIFMGDTGTMTVGLLIAISSIKITLINSTTQSEYAFNNPLAIVFALMSVIVFDLFRVAIIRFINKKSIFLGDNNHIHHILLKLGFSHVSATFFIVSIMLLQFVTAILLDKIFDKGLIIIIINSCFVLLFYVVVNHFSRVRNNIKTT